MPQGSIMRSKTEGTLSSTISKTTNIFKKSKPTQPDSTPRHDVEDEIDAYNLGAEEFGNWLDQHFPELIPIPLDV